MREWMTTTVAWGRRVSADYLRVRGSLAAGGLAYFVALALAPAALALGTLAGLFLDPADVRSVLDRLVERAPESLGDLQPIVDALVSTVETASASAFTVTTIISLVIAVYAASKVVYGLRLALNSAFQVEENRSGLIERAISAVATLVGLVLAVAVVVLLTIVPRVLEWLGVTSTPLTTGSGALDWVVALGLVFLAVRWTLAHGSNQRIRVPWLSPGAWVATAGVAAATIGVGIYARYSGSLSAAVLVFGTAVVILLWVYLCFVAVIWGALIEADALRRRTTSADPPPTP